MLLPMVKGKEDIFTEIKVYNFNNRRPVDKVTCDVILLKLKQAGEHI